MKKSDPIVIAVLYAITIFFVLETLKLPPEAQTYPLCLLGALFFLISLYALCQTVKYVKTRVKENDLTGFEGFLVGQFFGVCGAVVAYLVVMQYLGYYIATVLFMIGLMAFLRVRILYALITCALLMAVVYGVFTVFLNVPLPVGMLFE